MGSFFFLSSISKILTGSSKKRTDARRKRTKERNNDAVSYTPTVPYSSPSKIETRRLLIRRGGRQTLFCLFDQLNQQEKKDFFVAINVIIKEEETKEEETLVLILTF